MALALIMASAIFFLAEANTRPKVCREMFILSAAASCSNPSSSCNLMDSCSSKVRTVSFRAAKGIPLGLKYVELGRAHTHLDLLGLGTRFSFRSYERMLITIYGRFFRMSTFFSPLGDFFWVGCFQEDQTARSEPIVPQNSIRPSMALARVT
jgi:hypothetical protein